MKNLKIAALATMVCLMLLGVNGCKKEDNETARCGSKNTAVTLAEVALCYEGNGINYGKGKLPSGDSVETMRLQFFETTGLYVYIDLNTISYFTSPSINIQKFEINTEYFQDFAYPIIPNAVQIKNVGSFKFTKFDRTNRKASGTFEFNYVINTNQGNVDRNMKGTFTDVSF